MNSIALTANLPPPGLRPARPITLRLPTGAAERTQEELRIRSASVRESLVVWAGRPSGHGIVTVTHLLGLDCEAARERLVVPFPERIATLEFLRSNQVLAFADLHTHPEEAFLSRADRARPFGMRDGFYAIVVPDFAHASPFVGWAMYEVVARDWQEVSLSERIAR